MKPTLLPLFLTGFVQVTLVAANTYCVVHEHYAATLTVGFGISFVWTINVKKVAFGSWPERIAYALGAGCGSLAGLLTAKLILA